MTSEFFFLPRSDIEGMNAVLKGPEHHHLRRVLRARTGDRVWLFDEDGCRYRAEVTGAGEETTELAVMEILPPRELATKITLAAGLLKAATMDEVVLRAAELGASRVSPVETERSVARVREQAERKVERWRKIALAAAKQSRAARPPQIDAPVPLRSFLAACRAERKLFLDENGGSSLKTLRSPEENPPADAAVLVGPEGGWSETEREAVLSAGFEPFALGPTILRAETAALSVLTILAHEWNW
ncbi:MAG: 16S rRNA (uracil(1498)-N(3))-methyltransferase [Candidatus Aminicenantes bacterium]|nr:16S rRNA (uracil(1498)-N(3))-methyltransferase [Candidatus Aminicenantes bacterium]